MARRGGCLERRSAVDHDSEVNENARAPVTHLELSQ